MTWNYERTLSNRTVLHSHRSVNSGCSMRYNTFKSPASPLRSKVLISAQFYTVTSTLFVRLTPTHATLEPFLAETLMHICETFHSELWTSGADMCSTAAV